MGADFDEVLTRAQRGDELAIAQLFRSYNPQLLRYFAGRVGVMNEDLAQEVWLSVANGLATFEGDEPQFGAWLFTIARRRAIDHVRKIGRRPIREDAELPDLAQPDEIDHLSVAEAIDELTAGLSDDQSDVLLLRVVAGLNVKQVASIVGKTASAVRAIQHRALRQLAETIDEGCNARA